MSKHILGQFLVGLYALFFSCSGALIKLISANFNLMNTSFYLFFFTTLFSMIFSPKALFQKVPKDAKKWVTLRSVFGFIAITFYTLAIHYSPLVSAVLLSSAAPLFLPFILYVWCRIKISSQLAVALIIGFIGVALILKPDVEAFGSFKTYFGVLSAFFGAFMLIALRRATKNASSQQILVRFGLFSTIVIALILTVTNQWEHPSSPTVWIELVVLGLAFFLGQSFLNLGSLYAPPHYIAPYLYLTVVFSGLLGWVFWKETPDFLEYIGIIYVVFGALVSSFIGPSFNLPKKT